jgi:hypothetical protein
MKSLKATLIATVLTTAAGSVMADGAVIKDGYIFEKNQLVPTGVRAEVGTTGYGGAIQWTASPYVGLSLGYNGGDLSWSDDIKINGSKYDVDMNNKNIYLNAEIHPWGTSDNRWAQGFYVAAGAAYLKNDYDLDRRVDGTRSFTVNNTDFLANAEGVHINGKMKYDNSLAPYLGLGIAPKFGKNWGVFGEVGAYYTGNPTVTLQTVSGSATNTAGTSLDAELANEAHKLENDNKYAWMPVGKVGVNFYW